MRHAAILAVLLLVAAPALAQKMYNREGHIFSSAAPLTPGQCLVVDSNTNTASFQACPGGGGGSISSVWTDSGGDVSALVAASGDTFDAGAADSSKPCKRSATLPVGACAEGDCYQDTDSGGIETYICTATNTWTKILTGTDIDTSAELAALVTNETGTAGQLVFSQSPVLDQPFIADYSLAGHNHADTAGGGNISITSSTTGTLTVARGGTNATSFTANRCVRVNSGATALESATGDCGSVTGTGTDNVLTRWNGTAGALQDSVWVVDDAGLTSASTTQTATSATVLGLDYLATMNNSSPSTMDLSAMRARVNFVGGDDQNGTLTGLAASATNTGSAGTDNVSLLRGGSFTATTVTGASTTTDMRGISVTATKGSTGAVTSLYGVHVQVGNLDASGIVTNAYGVYVANSTTTGTLTNDYALYTAGTESSRLGGPLIVGDATITHTSDGPPLLKWDGTITQNYSGSFQGGVDWNGTVVLNDNPSGVAFHGFRNRPKITNQAGEVRAFGAPFAFQDSQNMEADGSASSAIATESFAASPVFTTANGGTLTVLRQLGFSCSGTYGAGVTMTERNCYRAGDPNTLAGTIQTNVGMIVEPLTATVASIGMRNMDTMIFTPKVHAGNNPVTAGTAIALDGTVVELTASGNTTMTATPTIADPGDTTSMNGQWVTLCNADSTDTITLNSGSSYNLQLRASTVALAAGQCLQLLYNNTKGLWLEADLNSAAGAGAGSGTDGHLVRWDVANALQDSTITVSDLGELVSAVTSTSASGAVGHSVTLTGNQSSGTPTFTGVQGTVTTGGSAAADGSLIGGYFSATCASSNACDAVTGVAGFGTKLGTGAVTPVMGGNFGISNLAANDVAVGYGVFVTAPVTVTGGFSTSYGLFIQGGYTTAIRTNSTDLVDFAGPVEADSGLTTPRVELTEAGSDPSCSAGNYALAANSSTTRNRQCINGTVFNVGKSDILGPGSSTDNAIVRWDGTTGLLIQDNDDITISDGGTLTGVQTSTSTTGVSGISYTLTQNHASGTPTHTGITGAVTTGGSSAAGGILIGGNFSAACATSNGCDQATGVAGFATKSVDADVSPLIGGNFGINNLSATTPGSFGAGVFINSPFSLGGDFSASYGLYIQAGYSSAIRTNGGDLVDFAGPVEADTSLTTPRVELVEAGSDPPCSSGNYNFGANSSGTPRVRQCVNGTVFNVGKGDVVGPASSTDNAIVRWDSTTGQLLQDNDDITISDAGTLTGVQTSTDTTGVSGISYTLTQNHASGTPTHRAINAVMTTGSGSAAGGIGIGFSADTRCATSNGCASETGVVGSVTNDSSGTITTAIGMQGTVTKNSGNGVITTAYGGYFGLLDLGGANAIATGYGVYIANSVEVTAITNDWALYTAGTESSRFGGPLGVGINPATDVQLHVTQGTVGNEVARFESVATNDDPADRWYHSRATAAASSTTNIDFNLTTGTRCPSSSVCIVKASTRCHCTSGSSCTAQDGAVNESIMGVKNVAGTITLIGAMQAQPLPTQISGSSITSLTLSVSTPNARMAVVVPANYAHTCHVTWQISPVGT